ncbi:MAG: hypothetical protein PUK75_14900 [bacterium]|nr:hypothetical protein [bacterium]MDY4100278.1 hypothetical protein [Lachnospiraceae bacterium]
MIWYDDLFLGKSISPRRKKRIIRKVNRRSVFGAEYLLTLSSNPDNLLDIISVRVVRQRYYPKKGMVVVGLAGDYEEAMLLAGEIISGIYAASGDFKVRDFFETNRQSAGEDGQSC